MKRIKENPYSTILGVVCIIAAFALLFVETTVELPLYANGALFLFGVLMLFAKDRLIDFIFKKGNKREK